MANARERVILCIEADCAATIHDGESSFESRRYAVDPAFDCPTPAFEPVRQEFTSSNLLKQDLGVVIDLRTNLEYTKKEGSLRI